MSMKIYDEGKIRAIAEKIRQKTGGDDTYTTTEMPSGIDKVFMKGYEKGDNDRYNQMMGSLNDAYNGGYTVGFNDGEASGIRTAENNFWNTFQDNGNRTDYNGAFSGTGWTNENFKPKYELNNIKSAASMFQYSGIKSILKELDFKNCTNMSYTFANSEIEYIHYLKIGTSAALTNTFTGANKLYHLGIEGIIYLNLDLRDCPLNLESIHRIVNALAPASNNKSLKLNKAAVDTAFESESNANNGSESAEWLALKNSRSNWQIELV